MISYFDSQRILWEERTPKSILRLAPHSIAIIKSQSERSSYSRTGKGPHKIYGLYGPVQLEN